jgi:peptide/nickel transport system permease protein
VSLPAGEAEVVLAGTPDPTPDPTGSFAARSPRQIAWHRLKQDRLTLAALGVVGLIVGVAVAAPILVHTHVLGPDTVHTDLLDPNRGSLPIGSLGGVSSHHWLGVVPGSGQDVLARVVYGLTFDLSIALAATVVTVVVGVAVGVVAGYFGGFVDNALGRVIDFILAFPQLLMLLALTPIFVGQPVQNSKVGVYLILVLGFFGWPYFARIIRGEVLSLRQREFIEAARSLGARPTSIMFREILPNLGAPILIYATIVLPTYVSAEAALAYLGISLQTPFPTLGTVLSDSINYASSDTTYFLIPGLLLVIVVLAFNLLGDGLRDALDPKGGRV